MNTIIEENSRIAAVKGEYLAPEVKTVNVKLHKMVCASGNSVGIDEGFDTDNDRGFELESR